MQLPSLLPLIVLPAGVNLVIGVTLATSAAMVTGYFHQSANYYAALQTGGGYFHRWHSLGDCPFFLAVTWLGTGLLRFHPFGRGATAFSKWPLGYAIGLLMVIGFDKMFSVYIRTRRLEVIPEADLGKTTGQIVMLNNLSQPAAGLFVVLFAGQANTQGVITAMTIGMGVLGCLAMYFGRLRK